MALTLECSFCGCSDITNLIFRNIGHNAGVICKCCGHYTYDSKSLSEEDIHRLSRCDMGYDAIRNYQFTDAKRIFEGVLHDYPDCADAYWGLLQAKYGIVYVKGFYTGEVTPIYCFPDYDPNNIEYITDTPEYAKLLKLLEDDAERLSLYKSKAEDIDNALDIFANSKDEEPIDVFLCVKISRALNTCPELTEKTVLDFPKAQELREKLTARGKKVFFSYKNLTNNLESDMDIWKNLVKSRKMLLITSSREYLESVWVRSEWERWLNLGEEQRKNLYIYLLGDDKTLSRRLPQELRGRQFYTEENENDLIEDLCFDSEAAKKEEEEKKLLEKAEEEASRKAEEERKAEEMLKTFEAMQKELNDLRKEVHQVEDAHTTEESGNSIETPKPKEKKSKKGFFLFPIFALAAIVAAIAIFLFPKGDECIHRNQATIKGYAATCTASGLSDGKTCLDCGETITNQVVISAKGHLKDTVKGYAATCTTSGLSDGTECSVCGHVFTEQTIIPAKGHTEDTVKGYAATCTTSGLTDGKKCSVCNVILATQATIPAKGHVQDTVKGYAATCTTSGLTDGTECPVCGHVFAEQTIIPAKGHTQTTVKGYAATCTTSGLTDGAKCSVCNVVLAAQNTIEASGHNYVSGTCTRCNAKAPECAHTNKTTIKGYAATCTTSGLTDGKKCSDCGAVLTAQTTIKAKGHTETTIKGYAATCTASGLTDGKKCSVCDTVLTAQTTIKAKGHTETIIKGYAATCTASGLTDGKKCSVCDVVLAAQNTIPAKGHTQITVSGYAATCTANGLTDGKICSVCDTILAAQNTIKALGHNYVSGTCTRCNETESKLSYTLSYDGTYYIVSGIGSCTDTEIVIPSTYNGKPVKAIGENAFLDCSSLTSVTIPDGVTSIGADAFYNCSSLTSINIPASVASIGEDAFAGCYGVTSVSVDTNNKVYYSKGNCIIEKSSKTLVAGFTCSTIPNDGSVTSIGCAAFRGMNITSITIPNSVTYIDQSAFEECNKLTSITIPNSVTYIDAKAFYGCNGVTSVSVDANNKVYYSKGNCIIEKSSKTLVAGFTCSTIPTDGSVTSIGYGAFEGMNITSVTIPNSVTSIGESAFSDCSSLTSITIPNSVTSIGNYAFYNCSSLTSITIPNSVTSIGEYAFSDCTKLTSITIPNSVTSIGKSAFYYCHELTSINFLGTKAQWDAISFGTDWNKYVPSGCVITYKEASSANLAYTLSSDGTYYIVSGIGSCTDTEIVIPSTYNGKPVKEIGKNAFSYCSSVTSITIPNGVTTIGERAFVCCESLTSITIPNGVTSIGSNAFNSCKKLTSVTIPDGVTTISTQVFTGCSSLTNVTIPASVTYIGMFAFGGCNSLTSINIPASVTYIGNYAFGGCSGVTSVSVDANNKVYYSKGNCIIEKSSKTLVAGFTCSTIPNDGSVTSIGDGAFEGMNITSITIPNSVTSIGNSAFEYCSSLASVTIPNSVTSIGQGAFYKCTSLTSITIPDGVTSIGKYAFDNCNKLTSITIPNSVTSIGNYAFSDCTSLASVTIPASVTSIGQGAFYGCSGVTSVSVDANNKVYYSKGNCIIEKSSKTLIAGFTCSTIPTDGSVTSIGYDAFDGMNITSITIPASVTSIGERAFANCTKLTSITIPNSVTSIGYEAFYNCRSLTSINFLGTKAQWDAISFGTDWNKYVPSGCVITYKN